MKFFEAIPLAPEFRKEMGTNDRFIKKRTRMDGETARGKKIVTIDLEHEPPVWPPRRLLFHSGTHEPVAGAAKPPRDEEYKYLIDISIRNFINNQRGPLCFNSDLSRLVIRGATRENRRDLLDLLTRYDIFTESKKKVETIDSIEIPTTATHAYPNQLVWARARLSNKVVVIQGTLGCNPLPLWYNQNNNEDADCSCVKCAQASCETDVAYEHCDERCIGEIFANCREEWYAYLDKVYSLPKHDNAPFSSWFSPIVKVPATLLLVHNVRGGAVELENLERLRDHSLARKNNKRVRVKEQKVIESTLNKLYYIIKDKSHPHMDIEIDCSVLCDLSVVKFAPVNGCIKPRCDIIRKLAARLSMIKTTVVYHPVHYARPLAQLLKKARGKVDCVCVTIESCSSLDDASSWMLEWNLTTDEADKSALGMIVVDSHCLESSELLAMLDARPNLEYLILVGNRRAFFYSYGMLRPFERLCLIADKSQTKRTDSHIWGCARFERANINSVFEQPCDAAAAALHDAHYSNVSLYSPTPIIGEMYDPVYFQPRVKIPREIHPSVIPPGKNPKLIVRRIQGTVQRNSAVPLVWNSTRDKWPGICVCACVIFNRHTPPRALKWALATGVSVLICLESKSDLDRAQATWKKLVDEMLTFTRN